MMTGYECAINIINNILLRFQDTFYIYFTGLMPTLMTRRRRHSTAQMPWGNIFRRHAMMLFATATRLIILARFGPALMGDYRNSRIYLSKYFTSTPPATPSAARQYR